MGLFLMFDPAFAATVYDETFESYSTGVWVPNYGTAADIGACTRDLTITTAQAHAGTKSLLGDRTGSGANCTQMLWEPGESASSGTIVYTWWWRSTAWVAGVRTTMYDDESDALGVLANGGDVTLSGATSIPGGTGLSVNTWHKIEWEFNFTADTQRARINGGTWSSTESSSGTWGELSGVLFWVAPSTDQTVYWDDFELTGSSLLDPEVSGATVTIVDHAPNDPWYVNSSPFDMSAWTDVDASENPGETGVMDFRLWKDGVNVASFISDLQTGPCNGGPANDNYCGTYVFNGNWIFSPGFWEIDASVTFDGYSASAFSTKTNFTVDPGFGTYGGADGNFDGTPIDQATLDDIQDLWGGGQGDWDTFISTYPTHDTVYGACDWWGSSAGDGLPCLWTWFAYAVFPDSTQFRNVLATPIGVLTTRWPFAYIFNPINTLINAIENGGDVCPIPAIFPDTMELFGNTVELPEDFSLCTAFDNADASTVIAANAYASNVLLMALYVMFAMLWFDMARRFLRG